MYIAFKGYICRRRKDGEIEYLNKRVIIMDNIGAFIPKVYVGIALEEIWVWLKQIDILHTL